MAMPDCEKPMNKELLEVYKKKCDEYREVLKENVQVLLRLDENEYPNLHKRLRISGSIRKKLITLIQDGISKKNYLGEANVHWDYLNRRPSMSDDSIEPGTIEGTIEFFHRKNEEGEYIKFLNQRYFWFASLRHLSVHEYDITRWSKALALLAAFGLIIKRDASTLGADERTQADEISLEFAHYQAKAKADKAIYPTMWYHVPAYDALILEHADTMAEKWNAAGLSLDSISKSTLIRVYGQDIADIAYPGGRVIPAADIAMQQELTYTLNRILEEKGYAYAEEVIQ